MSVTVESPVVASVIPRPLEERLVAQHEDISMETLIHPASLDELLHVVSLITSEIEAGERIQVIVPRSYSHHENGECDWDHIEELHMRLGGYALVRDVFVKVCFSESSSSDAMADIVCV